MIFRIIPIYVQIYSNAIGHI